MLKITLFENFRIFFNDSPISELNTPRMQSLLAYLLLNDGTPQSRSSIASIFWPDTSDSQARTNLRNLVHQLRQALPEADTFLESNSQTLFWHVDSPYNLDVRLFEQAYYRGTQKQTDHLTAVRNALESAVLLYTGDLLPACYDEWIISKREELRQKFLVAAERLIQIYEEESDYSNATSLCQRLLRFDPLHEATYRTLMRLHALNNDRAGAIRVYHTCATILERELEVGPSKATNEIYNQLLGIENPPSLFAYSPTMTNRTVGRIKEWSKILEQWRVVTQMNRPRILMLSGEAGIGKTRLVEDLLQWAIRQGITTCSARCYAAEGELSYAPVVSLLRAHSLPEMSRSWLAEISRILPEVLMDHPDLEKPAELTEAWQRERFFEALTRTILGFHQPMIIAVDDLQWCDRDTLEWLHYLSRFDHEARFLMVGTYRIEEVSDTHPLNSMLQALRNEGTVAEIELSPLGAEDARVLAIQLSGDLFSEESEQRLFDETEGNPLFIVETIRAGIHLTAKEEVADKDGFYPRESPNRPPRIRSVLETRLGQLSSFGQELTGAAAVIGRAFNTRLLSKIVEIDDSTLIRELDDLWRRRIVREHGTDEYDFFHDCLREAAYYRLSASRRRLLHSRVADALEDLEMDNPGELSRLRAAHYERANMPDKAVPNYLRAAKFARRLFSNEESIYLIQKGLSLIRDCRIAGSEENWQLITRELWEEMGDVLEITAQHEDALLSYQKAFSIINDPSGVNKARVFRKIATVYKEQRKYSEALDYCNQAELALGVNLDEDDAEKFDEWLNVKVEQVWNYYWLAEWSKMDELLKEIRPAVIKRGDISDQVRLHWVISLIQLRKERYCVSEKMVEHSREALDLSRVWGDLRFIVYCQFELGFQLLWRREFKEAEKNLLLALDLVEKSGNLPIRTLCFTYLTILHRFISDEDSVENYAMCALQAAEEAHMPDYIAAAKGNLAWLEGRRGHWSNAKKMGLEAVSIWSNSPLVYPFQWLALWPMMGALRTETKWVEIGFLVERLLDVRQQSVPVQLEDEILRLSQVIRSGDTPVLDSYMETIFSFARELGYL